MKQWVAIVAIIHGSIFMSHSCGLNWAKPTNHFDGVNPRGYLSHWEDWGSIQLSDELEVPFIVGFRSNRESTSPYLGKGWTAALLESYAVPVDERRYRVMMPDGYNFKFWRDRENPSSNIYHGSRGWKAQRSADGRNFTAWAPCGTKIEWRDGKIQEINTKGGKTVHYVYQGGLLSRLVDEQGAELVEVIWSKPGLAKQFILHQDNGSELKIDVEQDKKPEVQHVNGMNVIGELTSSLSKATWRQHDYVHDKREYRFRMQNEKMLPTLDIIDGESTSKRIIWNPKSRCIIRYGDWKYEINEGENADAFYGKSYAKISRINSKGKKQFWHNDTKKGIEETLSSNGVRTIEKRFQTGLLKGKIREIIKIKDDKKQLYYKAAYDEKGKLIREINQDGTRKEYSHRYSEAGNMQEKQFFENGKLKYTILYSDEGLKKEVQRSNGNVITYQYDELKRQTMRFVNGKIQSDKSYADDGSWLKEVVYDSGSETPSRTFMTEFDQRGRVAVSRIMDHSGDYPDIIKEYIYGDSGELIKEINSQQGTIWHLKSAITASNK